MHSAGEVIHTTAECKECKILREWNDELRDERDFFKHQWIESQTPKEVMKEEKEFNLSPISNHATSRTVRERLERKYREVAKKQKETVEL